MARRYRVYQVIGLIVGAVFLALGVAAFVADGGPIVGGIALLGGALCVVAAIVTMIRS